MIEVLIVVVVTGLILARGVIVALRALGVL